MCLALGLTLAAALLALAVPVSAASDDDALNDALDLSAAPEEEAPVQAGGARVFGELAVGNAAPRAGGSSALSRASLDLVWTGRLTPNWRAVLSNRLDHERPVDTGSRDATLNSLREAYLSWTDEGATRVVEFGRINLRHGPAYGYNPTDFFRDGSLRTVTSANPFALRENRLGTVALRAHRLWTGGSVALTLSPKLADAASGRTLNLDLGATNHRDRGLLTLNQQWSERVSTQWLLYQDGRLDLQPGASLTALLSDALVAHAEWSSAREPTLADRAWGIANHSARGQRLALGVSGSTAGKLSITLEAQHNGLALDKAGWAAAAKQPALMAAYLTEAERRQDLAARRAWMLYLTQADLGRKNLDLTALLRVNADDHSRMAWLELRQRWTQWELALQAQFNDGAAGSQWGSLADRRIVQLVTSYYLR